MKRLTIIKETIPLLEDLCSLHEEKKPITQPTTVFRRGMYYV